jgi:hypothetical protein
MRRLIEDASLLDLGFADSGAPIARKRALLGTDDC